MRSEKAESADRRLQKYVAPLKMAKVPVAMCSLHEVDEFL